MRRNLPSIDDSELLRVADQWIREFGADALSLRPIAERANTSTQAVYTHFGGKPGLADALFRQGYALLSEELDAVPLTGEPLVDIVELSRAYRRTALASPAHYQLMTARPIPEYRPPIESLRLARATMRPLFDTLDRGVEAGVFVGDPSEIATHLWAAGHGHISLEIHGFVDQDDAAFERLVGRMVHAHRT